jgi:TetR/AcrR family transcriptional regulator, transcriptional repressor for nem operon
MGHSQAQKKESRERILAIAAKHLLQRGLEGFSIADLMKDAGLTHGGFYNHFESRDDLVAQAIASALNGDSANKRTLKALLEDYLSQKRRDAPDSSCAVALLLSDVARAGKRVRDLYTAQVKRNFEGVARLGQQKGRSADRAKAIVTFSAMAGALALARAVSDGELSSEILQTVREYLVKKHRGK